MRRTDRNGGAAKHVILISRKMLRFSQLCESVAATSKKTEKVRLVADYFRNLRVEEAVLGALLIQPSWPSRSNIRNTIAPSAIARSNQRNAARGPAGAGICSLATCRCARRGRASGEPLRGGAAAHRDRAAAGVIPSFSSPSIPRSSGRNRPFSRQSDASPGLCRQQQNSARRTRLPVDTSISINVRGRSKCAQ